MAWPRVTAWAAVGVGIGFVGIEACVIMPVAWLAASVLAVLFYHPLFAHHLVMLSLTLALVAAVGVTPSPSLPTRRREMTAIVGLALVMVTAVAGAVVAVRDVQFALVPDRHNAEVIAAV